MFKMNILFGRAAPARTLPPGGGTRGRRRRGGVSPPLPRPASRQGSRPPRPSRGRGNGGTWFPHVHGRRSCARRAPRPLHTARERGRPARATAPRARCPRSQPMFTSGGVRPGNLRAGDAGAGGVGAGFPRPYPGPPPGRGCAPPDPPTGWGHGETGFPHAPAGRGRGETRFPHTPLREPMFTLGGVRPGNLRAGDAGASGVGAGFPRPYPGPPPGRGCALPNLPTGWGNGETRFPHSPAQGLRPHLPAGGGWGNRVPRFSR